MAIKTFRGIIAPVATPFTAAGEADAGRFAAHASWLLANGCTGLAPFGTTSEANAMSIAERKLLLVALLAGGIDPDLLLPGTGLCAVPDTVELTRHALDLGCGGVLMLPPFYHKGVSDEGLYRFYAQVIERVADARLRVYLYHIPAVTQIGLSLPLVTRLRRDFPSQIAGLKDSSGDWAYAKALIEALPGFAVFSSSETLLLDNLKAGGAGCISATANVNCRQLRQVLDAVDAGDWPAAEARQAQASLVRKAIEGFALIPATKAVLAQETREDAWRLLRAPLEPLPEVAARALAEKLGAIGFTLGAAATG